MTSPTAYSTSSHIVAYSRAALVERIAVKRYEHDVLASMPWHASKAAIVKRVNDELYALTVQLQNMR